MGGREEIQCDAHVKRNQNRGGSQNLRSVEDVANDIKFACNNMAKHESLCCTDRSGMPRSITMGAHI